MPPVLTTEGWRWQAPSTPTEHFGDALMWHSLTTSYRGWWDQGAGELAHDNMDAAMAGAGL